jgi:uncharacterized protein (TIGR02186 family)
VSRLACRPARWLGLARSHALLIALALLLAAAPARAEDDPLVATLSQTTVNITTAFTGESIMVFGATDQPLGPGGDEVVVVARGPTAPLVVRRKVRVLGMWVNGPSARFPQVPGFYAIAGTRRAWQILPEAERRANGLGLDNLPLESTGARNPQFRAALLALERERGMWIEDAAEVQIEGSRLFHVRLPLPATVEPGEYSVEVLLVRSRRIIARHSLSFIVERTGTADRIATVAEQQPLLYGVVCVVLAALAGWVGSVVFRRG